MCLFSMVRKVIAQCKALKLKEIALAAAERYKHKLRHYLFQLAEFTLGELPSPRGSTLKAGARLS